MFGDQSGEIVCSYGARQDDLLNSAQFYMT